MMGVWDQVEALLAEGKGVQITLTAAQELKFPKQPRGRPRRWLPPFLNYAYWEGTDDIKERMGGHRPRCQRRGCGKYLRKDQRWVCSEECADAVINSSLLALAALHYESIDQISDFTPALCDETLRRYREQQRIGFFAVANAER
jgi:hypothetical protein